jgi:hypothetical protein
MFRVRIQTEISLITFFQVCSGTHSTTYLNLTGGSYNKNQRDALISQIYFWYRTLHVSDRFTVHQQEFSTLWQVPTAVYTVLDSWWWTVNLSETCRVLYQNKFEKQCISLVFIIKIYHDARSSECQIQLRFFARAFTFLRRWSKSRFLFVRMFLCTNKLHLFSLTQHRLIVVETVTFYFIFLCLLFLYFTF